MPNVTVVPLPSKERMHSGRFVKAGKVQQLARAISCSQNRKPIRSDRDFRISILGSDHWTFLDGAFGNETT